MFAPLGALLTDHVEDSGKGLAAGMLNLALPLSGLVVTLLGLISARDSVLPFLGVALLVASLVAPLLLAWPSDLKLQPAIGDNAHSQAAAKTDLPRNFALAFAARLLVQLGGAVMLGYLYFYVESIAASAADFPPGNASRGVAHLSLIATIISLVAGLVAGHLSDVLNRRRLPLVLAALVCAASLGALAMLDDWRAIVIAYASFVASLTAFLSIDSAMVAQLVGREPRRGALLGVMNLTNTLPAIIAPALTLAYGALVLSSRLFDALLLTTAAAALIAAGLIARIRIA